jgi:hypothetical protein
MKDWNTGLVDYPESAINSAGLEEREEKEK